jgi:hypothetical protein
MNSWTLKSRTVLMALLISSVPFAFGQTITTGDVTGTVIDSSKAVLPHATVTITYLDTNETRMTTSNDTGRYRFTFLKPGRYSVSAVSASMKSGASEFTLLVGQEAGMDLVMNVQGTTQTIEVTAAGSVVQTENANQATSFNEKQMVDLPMSGGDITNLAFTVTGIRVNVGGGNANFNANGVPFNATQFTINGGDIVEPYNNNNKSGASNNTLGANDISETAVILNAFSAQYGRMAGAQVNYVTKSGTNAFHGNLSESYNDAIFNANGFFNNATGTPRGRSVANQYAASLGGPIIKNKTFFFVNTEALRYALPSTGVVSVPSPQLQQYILAEIPAASVPLYQDAFSLYNNAPGINRAVPVTNGTGLLQDGFGNLGCGHQKFPGTFLNGSSGQQFGVNVPCADTFGTNTSSINIENLLSGRVDHTINDKQRIFFRFSDDWGTQATSTSPVNPVFNQQSVQPWYTGQLNHTYIISPTMVNNFVVSINYYSAVFGVPDFAKAQTLMPAEFTFGDGGANGSNGFTPLGVPFPTGRRGAQFQIIDDLSRSKGKHTVQGGINFRRNRVTDTSIASGSQIGTYTINDLTDFAIGQVNSTNTGSNFTQSFPLIQAAHIRLYSLNYYIQDQWNVSPNLKVTYGIRFEQNENPGCTDNCFSRLNTAFGTNGGANVPYNSSITTGLGRAFPNMEAIIPDPRFGIVYTPFGQNKTVFRAGVGAFANTFPGNLAASVFANSPAKFSPTVSFGNIGLPGVSGTAAAAAVASDQVFQTGFSQGFTLNQFQSALGKVPFGVPAYYIPPSTFHEPKVVEWSFEIEQPLSPRDVLSITYSGNHGYDESVLNQDANAYIGTVSRFPNGFGGLPTVAPDSRFSTVTELLNSGYSNYDGLSAQVRHAFSLGFQGQIGYTWSHALQTGAVLASSGASSIAEYNPYNLAASYGPTNFDTRQNLSADVVYNPPKFRKKLMESVFGGWTIGAKMYLYSGRPFSVLNSQIPGLLSTTFGGPVLADLLNPSLLGTHCGNVNARCLTPSEFATSQTQDDFGNIPPNSFRGPGYFDIDTQLTKKVPVTEHTAFQFGASAYNLLNHPNFANPNNNVASGSFGTITSTVSAPTSIYGAGQGALVSGRVLVVVGKFNF